MVRGPSVTPGYWRNPEATAEAFTSDGFFRTGDMGSLDDDGFLFIRDRIKDMIITGGENVYPAEVESVLADPSGGRRDRRGRYPVARSGARRRSPSW